LKLNAEQKHVLREVMKFPKKVQSIGGYGGTGKSTLVKHLVELLPDFSVCAYTGKAANVLRGKGVDACTIHSLIYKPYKDDDEKVYFALASSLDCKGLIVDEASMVSEGIYRDLLSFGKPIIFVGDHGQLEPVGDKFNLMENPDYRLETIHRNAGEIAHFAEHIRSGYRPASWESKSGSGGSVKFVAKSAYHELVPNVEQVICAFNKTRAETNVVARKNLGLDPAGPVPGDKVICLKNDRLCGLFNGMQGVVNKIYAGDMFLLESGGDFMTVAFDRKVFNQVKYEFDQDRDAPSPFDYSYAITAHKSQGSEFDSVLVLEQRCDLWEHKRWAYTAASRAKKTLYWCVL
jgi:exodeoxyribonuclease-5